MLCTPTGSNDATKRTTVKRIRTSVSFATRREKPPGVSFTGATPWGIGISWVEDLWGGLSSQRFGKCIDTYRECMLRPSCLVCPPAI